MPALFSPGLLLSVMAAFPRTSGAALAEAALLHGEATAEYCLHDWLLEVGATMTPFQVGDKVLIMTATLYWVGEVEQSTLMWTWLKNASWVHWTGRLSTLMAQLSFESSAHGSRRPRTEYVGRVRVWHQAITDDIPFPGNLPTQSIQ